MKKINLEEEYRKCCEEAEKQGATLVTKEDFASAVKNVYDVEPAEIEHYKHKCYGIKVIQKRGRFLTCPFLLYQVWLPYKDNLGFVEFPNGLLLKDTYDKTLVQLMDMIRHNFELEPVGYTYDKNGDLIDPW